jgi:PAS domain S-box-containing protein
MRLGLRARYSLVLVGTALLIIAAVATTLLAISWRAADELQRSSSQAMSSALLTQLEKRGRGLVSVLTNSLAEPVAIEDFDGIVNIAGAAAELSDVAFVMVYDRDGMVLHDGTAEIQAYGRPAPENVVEATLRGGEWLVETLDDELRISGPIVIGRSVYGAVSLGLRLDAAIQDTAGLQAELDTITRQSARQHIRSAILLTAMFCIACVLIGFFLSGRMSRPVVDLTALTRRIARGHYDVEIPWERRDELGELATSVKSMSEELRRTTVSKSYVDNIIETMLDGLLVVSPDGAIETVNAAACRFTGYAREELVGLPVWILIEPRNGRESADTGARLAQDRLQSVDVLYTKAGTPLPVLFSSSEMSVATGHKHIVCAFRDISDLIQREKELEAAKEEAEAANRTKSQFLANMSHELRSPLNAIIGFAEIMKDEIFGPLSHPTYREYARDIRASGTHLLELINGILDLSKIEAGKLELREQVVDIRSAIETCLRLMMARAEKAQVELVSNIDAGQPGLYADERKFKQILLNLLSNSVKFTPEGGQVMTTAKLDSAGRFVLCVADTGIGIAPEDMEAALSAFRQVDSSLSRKYEGTGLGLPLTKALVELHGGAFEIESEPGRGTTVTITFPADRTRQDRVPRPAEEYELASR